MEKVTIVIRTSGSSSKVKLLKLLLDSLANQTYKNFHVVIATQSNYKRVASLAYDVLSPNKVTILKSKYKKRTLTSELAIRYSIKDPHVEYVVILDDDLVLEPRWLEKMLSCINIDDHVGAAFSHVVNVTYIMKKYASYRLDLRVHTFAKKFITRVAVPCVVIRPLNKFKGYFAYPTLPCTATIVKAECLRRMLKIYKSIYYHDYAEPLRGDDYELGFRIRRLGYLILFNLTTFVTHMEYYNLKWSLIKPKEMQKLIFSEVYTYLRNSDFVSFSKILTHITVYVPIEGLNMSLITRSILTLPSAVYASFKALLRWCSHNV